MVGKLFGYNWRKRLLSDAETQSDVENVLSHPPLASPNSPPRKSVKEGGGTMTMIESSVSTKFVIANVSNRCL